MVNVLLYQVDIGSQLIGPVNGQTIAELLVKNADDIL